ncbi:MAG: hypothetical protein QME41_05715 [Actinomycetota bacterium]|nr:hypothetical protein [Actinomycetota bacterium]
MGRRAYLMVDVADDIDYKGFTSVLRELEEIEGVDFVDSVFGSCDMVIMVEAPVGVNVLADTIRMMPGIENLTILRIVSAFRHHAQEKQLSKFSKVLNHSGF